MILRWYYFLSSWALLLSISYPVHKQNPYPLQLFCLVGLTGIPWMAATEPVLKLIFIALVHILPFAWLPAIIDSQGILFALLIIGVYGLVMSHIHKNIITFYYEALTKHHSTTYAFMQELLGF
jgi:hypothetical protein